MLTQLPPGAAIVISGPRSEKPTLSPTWRSAVTPSAPGQLAGLPTALPPLLPAAATTTAPAALTRPMASTYAWLHACEPPRLMLRTRAGVAFAGSFMAVSSACVRTPAAQSMPTVMSES